MTLQVVGDAVLLAGIPEWAETLGEQEAPLLSARSKYVSFTDEMVEELSSIRHLDRLNCPVVVAYGDCESPEFMRQNEEFAAAVRKIGKLAALLIGIAATTGRTSRDAPSNTTTCGRTTSAARSPTATCHRRNDGGGWRGRSSGWG